VSSIGPNIIGSLFQAQVSSRESAKNENAQRNKRARDSEQLARLAEQQTHEVEDTEHTDPSRVHRQDERDAQDKDGPDAYEHHADHEEQIPDQAPPPQLAPQTSRGTAKHSSFAKVKLARLGGGPPC